MISNIKQSDILPTIVNIRCADYTELGDFTEKTTEYLNDIIENYKFPSTKIKNETVQLIMNKIIDNLHTYDPSASTYTKWVSNVTTQFVADIYGKTEDEFKIDGIDWNLDASDGTDQKNKLITKQNKYDTIYIKMIRKAFLKIVAENMQNEMHRKAVLLSFQNPLNQRYWIKFLKINEKNFMEYLIAGFKELNKILNEDKTQSSMRGIIKFMTEKLMGRTYMNVSEIAMLQNDLFKNALLYSIDCKSITEAAKKMKLTDEDYRDLLEITINELAMKINVDLDEETQLLKEPEKDTEDEEETEINLEETILDYYDKVLTFGIKQAKVRVPQCSDERFTNYRNMIDFMYLLFTEQFKLPNIAELLAFTINYGASDLHLSAGLPPIIRIEGDMRRINVPNLEQNVLYNYLHAIMNEKQVENYEKYKEIDFSLDLQGISRFRANVFTQNRGIAAVFRAIPLKVPTLEDIMAPEIFKELVDKPNGLILVTGPTGMGKSTTLAAMVDYKNKGEFNHIITIEDPIEFIYKSKNCLINQREVYRDTMGFSQALHSALREDPDIILVGELRDLETIRLALTAVETGHLVLGTLHTSSAAQTIDRIIDVFPAAEKVMVRFMLSTSINAVFSQTLVKKIGGGRIAAWEIMIANTAVRNLIREEKVHQINSVIETSTKIGMQTLEQHMEQLVRQGLVSIDEAKKVCGHIVREVPEGVGT